jgi:hypothetical protein
MGRLGFVLAATNDTPDDVAARNSVRAIETITRLPGLTVEGISPILLQPTVPTNLMRICS